MEFMKYKLRELIRIKNGKDHKGLNAGTYPVFGSGGVMRYVDSFLYDKPSVLLPRKGTLNNIQYADKPFWTVDTLYYTEVNENKANAYYLYNYLKLLDLSNLNSGTGVPSMTFDSYYNLSVKIPTLKVQNTIASVLSHIDKKISINREINRNLEELAKQIYDYWFVQFDFPNEDGKPYKTSGGKMVWDELLKREIPAGWEVGILSDIAYITMGQSPDGSSYNETGVGIIFYQGSTDFGIRFPTIRVYTTSPKRFAKKGDILMSVRAPVGILNIANHDCCIGRGLAALKSKVASMVHLWFTMEVFKQRFEGKNLSGTTFGAITKDELFSLPVVVPPKELLLMFNKKTLSIFNNQLSIGAEIDKLTSLRNSLLPLLMNGQVTLNSCFSEQSISGK